MLLLSETLPVLRLLSDGTPRAVAALATALGVAPARVCLAVEQLRELGLDVERNRVDDTIGLGRPTQMLDAARIRAQSNRLQATHPALHVLDQCDSTNDALRELALCGASSGTCVACEVQTGGRGRRGRKWIAPPGASVALSVLWRFACDVQALTGLSLAAAVAALRALERCGVRELAIKWPNDLLRRGSKVGGILVETVNVDGGCAAIIGVGVNLRLGRTARALIDSLRDPVRGPVAAGLGDDESDAGAPADDTPERNALVAALVDESSAACEVFERDGLEPFRDAWRARHAFQSAQVTISAGSEPVATGRAVDIADDGALIVETAQGRRRFYAGEVSLRS